MIRAILNPVILALLVVFLCDGSPAEAYTITVVNPSFEDYALPDGGYTLDGTGLTGYGWTFMPTGAPLGVFNPTSQFPLGIPDGENTLYTQGPTVSQVLSAVLTANTTYTLSVGVGDPGDVSFGGYAIQFLAGGALLAEDDNTLTPPNGGFVTSTVVFTAGATNPHLGEALEIRILHGGLGLESDFDLVELSAVSVPEPSSMVLLGTGMLWSMGRNRRRRGMLDPRGRG